MKFYEWLDGLPRGALPEGPAVWICGGCHLGHLGRLADADGRVDLQFRALDQTLDGHFREEDVRPLVPALNGGSGEADLRPIEAA